MQRRRFIQSVGVLSGAASLGGLTWTSCDAPSGSAATHSTPPARNFTELASRQLRTWTDALLAQQIDDPSRPEVHGVLWCPACDKIHGRCYDAVYPFLKAAAETGDDRYTQAAIKLFDWTKNIDAPDGSWTVIPDPKSWRGTTVFGATSVGEALAHHGQVLPKGVQLQWRERLARAAEYIYREFSMQLSHVNYGGTAVYALHLLAEVLDEPKYAARSRELAAELPDWFTERDTLLFGEDKPAREASPKGLLPVDLGYNVEETLGALALYSVEVGDDALRALVTKSLQSHLRFMLPDGAWDNSWGLRQNKWSYWGSRTCDGSQVALCALAADDARFHTAAIANLELMARCTVDGLLAGGPHYGSAGVQPCIHHSFSHAKALALVLDRGDALPAETPPLPRAVADGMDHVADVDVYLLARGPWRATLSCYDQTFKRPDSQAAAGGSLGVLYHETLGPICLASMADYVRVERNNMQELVGEDIALTPRLEVMIDGVRYTNLYDLAATAQVDDDGQIIRATCNVQLLNAERQPPPSGPLRYAITYELDTESVSCSFAPTVSGTEHPAVELIWPLISPSGERIAPGITSVLAIDKPSGALVLTTDQPFRNLLSDWEARAFNHVPGAEAVVVATKGALRVRLVES